MKCLDLGLCFASEENEQLKQSGNVKHCNDGNQLLAMKFFEFTPKDANSSCSFEDILVCRAYSNLRAGQSVDWNSSFLVECLGYHNLKPADFQSGASEKSDLYRYLMMYVLGWTITFFGMVGFFFYIKFSSKFDSLLFQPKRKHTNVLIRFGARQTPFSA